MSGASLAILKGNKHENESQHSKNRVRKNGITLDLDGIIEQLNLNKKPPTFRLVFMCKNKPLFTKP